jgi:hypothetical protein
VLMVAFEVLGIYAPQALPSPRYRGPSRPMPAASASRS